jgi:hypothetical protein
MLWESGFYEDGETIADRIASLTKEVSPEKVANLAIEARMKFKLRHIPLLLARELARIGYKKTYEIIKEVIQRPDELTEFLAIYWKDGRCPLSAQVKKGLAAAFTKFNAYQLAKYNRDEAIKLRDVLFLSHAKPVNDEQAAAWKKLVDGTLEAPDTWEVSLSSGKDKKETWERLLSENKLGGLALLRNLRNMEQAKVNERVIFSALASMKTERILPYRFIAAARYAPQWENKIEPVMLKCLDGAEKLSGKTILLVDKSGSMSDKLSAKSDLTRYDAACAVAIMLREICQDVIIATFNQGEGVRIIAPRHGFALRDAMGTPTGGTPLGQAIELISQKDHDRIIVITDEQSQDRVPNPIGLGYMINVASNRNGVGYGAWKHIDGFSEAVIDWIREFENIDME